MALCLTRRAGEQIHIGDDIIIRVFRIRGNQTTLHIDAPTHIQIHRDEIYKRIKDGVKYYKGEKR